MGLEIPPASFPGPQPLPMAPTSEDVDSELSKPRLFFPGGLLLVLTESLLPAEVRMSEEGLGLELGGSSAQLRSPELELCCVGPLTWRRQAIGCRDRPVGCRNGSRQGGEGHRELHVENLQSFFFGCQAENLLLEPLVFLLQCMQRLQHLHDCRERWGGRAEPQVGGGGTRGWRGGAKFEGRVYGGVT